jgi:hypothetical protein
MSRQVGRVNQQSKGETPLMSGILQRAAVRVVADKEVEATEDVESGRLRESRFRHDFSQVGIDRGGVPKEASKTSNQTGLPDNLKAGVENLSGYSLDDVRVHYNSPKPAQLQALAYTQGTEIHVAPGQEEHLPHEAWHVVQQMQGRVKPTVQMKGVQINNALELEREADVMGVGSLKNDHTPAREREKDQIGDRKVTQKTIIQLLSITDARADKVTVSKADRLEVPIVVTKDDGTTMTVTLNTSYKKHMVEAYTSGGIEITAVAAAINTIAKLTDIEFKKAFEDFAFLFAKNLSGSDPTTFDPSSPANELTTNYGLSFHSDNRNLGAEVHCFPTATAGNAEQLSNQEFKDLKLLTNIAYHTSGNLNNGAIVQANEALGRYSNNPKMTQLFNADHVRAFQRVVRAKIRASQENNQQEQIIKREAGILKGRIKRGEAEPINDYRG